MWHLVKDLLWRDNPIDPEYQPGQPLYYQLKPVYSTDQPEVHEIVQMMRTVLDEYGSDKLLVGEVYLPIDHLVAYYGDLERSGAHLPFNFQLIVLPWHAPTIGGAIDEYEALLPDHGWPNWVLGNHDKPRIASRTGAAQARVAAMLLLTLRGTPTLYYGDEIGMTDVEEVSPRACGPGVTVYDRSWRHGRLSHRTPMRWDGEPYAGFSTVEPWLSLGPDAETVNVAAAQRDQRSTLHLYRRLLALRRGEPALTVGTYRPIPAQGDLLLYIREHEGRRLLVTLNLGHATVSVELPELRGEVLVSTQLDRAGEAVDGRATMRPDEGLVTALA
jgi:alpha-glucosidase